MIRALRAGERAYGPPVCRTAALVVLNVASFLAIQSTRESKNKFTSEPLLWFSGVLESSGRVEGMHISDGEAFGDENRAE